jgi:hypothetical protein
MEEQHEPTLTPEEQEQKKHQEAHKAMLEKITRTQKEIGEILTREGLTLVVNHQISIVPKQ